MPRASFHPAIGLFVLAATLSLPLLIRADVTVNSLLEHATTSITFSQAGGGTVSGSNATTNFALPPVSLSAITSLPGPNVATAAIAVSTYSGALTVGGSTPGFTFVGSASVGQSAADPGTFTYNSGLTIDITLDQAQSYALSVTGFSHLYQMPGFFVVPSGSGILAPGNYQVDIFAPVTTFSSSIDVTIGAVPEPSALIAFAIVSLACRRRSRR